MAPTNRNAATNRRENRVEAQVITDAPKLPDTEMDDGSLNPYERFSTDITSETKNIAWELKNFKAMSQMKDNFKSMKINFEAGHTIGLPTKWCFFLRRDDDDLGLYLRILENKNKEKEIFARYDTVIKRQGLGTGVNGTLVRLSTEIVDMKGVADWGWNNVYSIAALVLPKNNILVNNTLTIELTFSIYSRNTVNIEEPKSPLSNLQQRAFAGVFADFDLLLESGNNADVTFQMKDGKKFRAHKAILGARSDVFKAMFETSMQESATGTVKIDDVSSGALKLMLRFIYTGKLDMTWKEYSEELIYIADKYALPILKLFLDKILLLTATNNDNALDMLKLARLHNLDNATQQINAFIKANVSGVLQSFQ